MTHRVSVVQQSQSGPPFTFTRARSGPSLSSVPVLHKGPVPEISCIHSPDMLQETDVTITSMFRGLHSVVANDALALAAMVGLLILRSGCTALRKVMFHPPKIFPLLLPTGVFPPPPQSCFLGLNIAACQNCHVPVPKQRGTPLLLATTCQSWTGLMGHLQACR